MRNACWNHLEVGASSEDFIVRVGLVFLAQGVPHARLDTTITAVDALPVLVLYCGVLRTTIK